MWLSGHLTNKNVLQVFDRFKNCSDNVKKWLSANNLKLNHDQTKFIIFGSKMQCEKTQQHFPVNILHRHLSSPAEAVKHIFFFLAISRVSSISEGISHVMLLSWLPVHSTIVNPCLEVSLLYISLRACVCMCALVIFLHKPLYLIHLCMYLQKICRQCL